MELPDIDGYDPEYQPIFHAGWYGYEESSWVWIFERDGKYYDLTGGYSVMCEGDQNTVWSDLREITEDIALEIMLDWDEHEDDV